MVSYPMLPPELNSLLMFSGAGPAPMLQAAAGWDALADELATAANTFTSVTSGLAGQGWQGPASLAMTATAESYAACLSVASVRASAAAGQAQAVASAFETARATTIHPLAVAANRSAFVQLVRSNILGLLGPAIATAEAQYEQMWAADVAAMTGYQASAAAAAAQLNPFAQLLAALPNLGLGNKGGTGNIGNGNNGTANIGSGNTGSGNIGGGNGRTGFPAVGNFGSGNNGNNNVGSGNVSNGNVGFGNTGDASSPNPGNNFGLGNGGQQ